MDTGPVTESSLETVFERTMAVSFLLTALFSGYAFAGIVLTALGHTVFPYDVLVLGEDPVLALFGTSIGVLVVIASVAKLLHGFTHDVWDAKLWAVMIASLAGIALGLSAVNVALPLLLDSF